MQIATVAEVESTSTHLALNLAMIGTNMPGEDSDLRSTLRMVAALLTESDASTAFYLACNAVERAQTSLQQAPAPEIFVLAGVVALLNSGE